MDAVAENIANYKEVVAKNLAGYKSKEYDYNTFLTNLLLIIEKDEDKNKYVSAVTEAIRLGPEGKDEDIKAKIELLCRFHYGYIPKVVDIKEGYGVDYNYNIKDSLLNTPFSDLSKDPYYAEFENKFVKDDHHGFAGGNRRNKAKPKSKPKPKPKPAPKAKHDDMNMKDIKDLCKANQIKLSKVVNEKRVRFTKKELLTKLKRKKLI